MQWLASFKNGQEIICKGILLGGTLDLQAKAQVVDMSPHNGEFGCLTCEEPGEVTPQGKGYARVYPSRVNKPPTRTTEGVLENGLAALERGKPIKGIKGVSASHGMNWFDVVNGLGPDHMHGVLLGVTKSLLKLHISSANSKKEFYIGGHLEQINKFLMQMKPTDEISRVPRKLSTNIHRYKASEFQMWLLFYWIPCLTDYLKPEYLDHFALLVEGIFILLSDSISQEQLARAEIVIHTFYQHFEDLYGKNNCTLNVHNLCHLPTYVRKLGPMWAWSCFPFENMNGVLMESVHGTGDICKQVL